MPTIFISYRRSDSQDVTGRIYDRLVSKLTPRQVFKDVYSIPLGVSFPAHIRQVLGKATVVLVVIGPDWLSARGEDGQRRLDDPNDFVRLEVELALRANIPVIPVLVSNARMPQTKDLPPSLHSLAARNGTSVRPDPDFHTDMERLLAGMDRLDNLSKGESRKTEKTRPQSAPAENPHEVKAEPNSLTVPAQTRVSSRARLAWAVGVGSFLTVALAVAGWYAGGVLGFQAANDPDQASPVAGIAKGESPPPLDCTNGVDTARAQAAQQAWAAALGSQAVIEIRLDDAGGSKMKLACIPPGVFMMGEGKSRREVKVGECIFMGATEVTQGQWRAVMAENPPDYQGDDWPMSHVSWEGCQKFCEMLSKRLGKSVRLPTDAEWEYSCRAGTTTDYYFGDGKESLSQYAWYYDNAKNCTHPVGTLLPNAWGLYDMHGNVAELCDGWYDTQKQFRAMRGGCWASDAPSCRAAACSGKGVIGYSYEGFRVVLCPR